MNAGKIIAFGGAGVAVWYFFLRTPAPTTGTTTSPLTAGKPITPAPLVSNGSLDAAFKAMVTKANGATSASIDEWDSYLMQGSPTLVAPDPMPIFSAAIPGFDRSAKFSAADYWKVMSPVIAKQYGLSGLGLYGNIFGNYRGGRW